MVLPRPPPNPIFVLKDVVSINPHPLYFMVIVDCEASWLSHAWWPLVPLFASCLGLEVVLVFVACKFYLLTIDVYCSVLKMQKPHLS